MRKSDAVEKRQHCRRFLPAGLFAVASVPVGSLDPHKFSSVIFFHCNFNREQHFLRSMPLKLITYLLHNGLEESLLMKCSRCVLIDASEMCANI